MFNTAVVLIDDRVRASFFTCQFLFGISVMVMVWTGLFLPSGKGGNCNFVEP